jgi:hypothetical protein
MKLRFFLAFWIPIFFTVVYWSQFIPKTTYLPYYIFYDTKKDIFSWLVKRDENGKIQKIAFQPIAIGELESPLISLLKLPEQSGQFRYCISHSPYVINNQNKNERSKDLLSVNTGSTVDIMIGSEEKCFDYKPNGYISGIQFDSNETKKKAIEWGLEDGSGTKVISAFDRIIFRSWPKYPSILFIIPTAFCAVWWGFLIIFAKLEKDFLDEISHTKKIKQEKRSFLKKIRDILKKHRK